MTPDGPTNPFALESEPELTPADRAVRRTLQHYRDQTMLVAVVWSIYGFYYLGIVGLALMDNDPKLRQAAGPNGEGYYIAATLGLAWLVCGLLTGMRHMFAVYLGLVVTYLATALNVLSINLCGLTVCIAMLVIAHRLIATAFRMRSHKVPTSTEANQ